MKGKRLKPEELCGGLLLKRLRNEVYARLTFVEMIGRGK